MRLIIFGPPGAGKGTQATLLEERRGLKQISTGDIIRNAMKNETPVGKEAKAYVEQGELVPDEVVRKLAENAVADQGYDDFVLDGYPRTDQQAEWLTDFLTEHDAPLDAVLSLDVPDEVIVRRLSRRRVHAETGETYHLDHDPPPEDVDADLIVQRDDDQPETVRNRIEVYREETEPLEEYYDERDLLVPVDGE
jgi:adenylate kinase